MRGLQLVDTQTGGSSLSCLCHTTVLTRPEGPSGPARPFGHPLPLSVTRSDHHRRLPCPGHFGVPWFERAVDLRVNPARGRIRSESCVAVNQGAPEDAVFVWLISSTRGPRCRFKCFKYIGIGIVVTLCFVLCSETLLVIIRSGNCFTRRREIERSRVLSSLSREYKLFESRSATLVFKLGG